MASHLTFSVSKKASPSWYPTVTMYRNPQSRLITREGSMMVKRGSVSLEASDMLLDEMGAKTAISGSVLGVLLSSEVLEVTSSTTLTATGSSTAATYPDKISNKPMSDRHQLLDGHLVITCGAGQLISGKVVLD